MQQNKVSDTYRSLTRMGLFFYFHSKPPSLGTVNAIILTPLPRLMLRLTIMPLHCVCKLQLHLKKIQLYELSEQIGVLAAEQDHAKNFLCA